jgi:PIN domain nuclease of toxin-antitoxin system
LDLLLETHIVVRWQTDDPRLGETARVAIRAAPRLVASAASAREAATRISQGKLTLPEPFESGVEALGAERLPIAFDHAQGTVALPWHRMAYLRGMACRSCRLDHRRICVHCARAAR